MILMIALAFQCSHTRKYDIAFLSSLSICRTIGLAAKDGVTVASAEKKARRGGGGVANNSHCNMKGFFLRSMYFSTFYGILTFWVDIQMRLAIRCLKNSVLSGFGWELSEEPHGSVIRVMYNIEMQIQQQQSRGLRVCNRALLDKQ